MAAKIFTDSSYKDLGDAIRERLKAENLCLNSKICFDLKAKKFDKYFKGYFPSLEDEECAIDTISGGNKETLNKKCFTGIFNVGDNPTVVVENVINLSLKIFVIIFNLIIIIKEIVEEIECALMNYILKKAQMFFHL